MTPEERLSLIQQYKAGYDEVMLALEGFPADRLTSHPIAGKWSAAQIVHHLADSEGQSATRLRKLLTETHPVIQGYDQEQWAIALHYESRPIAPALAAFRAARETTAQLLEVMSDADWRKLGWHTDNGPYHAEHWLEIYAAHASGHAKQIQHLKEALAQ
ncbi:MAG: DinB family protein [Candidatus Eisenbacteria bacterium]